MQDLHAIVGGRMFDATSMDRRLRPHGNHHGLKCPRCDSLNTKFCYYNNYNLSQPRYFCKSCRRYWTKGGVLRNVPVGGGCRKNKRSKVKTTPMNTASTADEVATATVMLQQIDRKLSSLSSSESSGLTAATTEFICASTSAGLPNTFEYKFPASKSNCGGVSFCHGAFADTEGFVAASVSEPIPVGFNYSSGSQDQWQQQQQDQIPGTFLDQTVQVDLASVQSEFVPFDWQSCKDQGWVDLSPGTVDQAYWSQSQIQWTENDQPCLYLQ